MIVDEKDTVRVVRICHASGRGAAARWASQYQRDGKWSDNYANGSPHQIYDRLVALGETPDPAAVASIIGNKSWSYLHCSGCGAEVLAAVAVEQRDSEEPVLLCVDCIGELHQAAERIK